MERNIKDPDPGREMESLLTIMGRARLLRLVTATMVVVIVGLQSYSLWQARQAAWLNGQRDAENVLRTLTFTIERSLYVFDLSLRGVQESMKLPDLEKLPPGIRNLVLFDRAATASFFGTMLVIDENGDMRIRADRLDPGQGNFADRDYFSVHRTPIPEPFVSKPFASRIGGYAPSIALSRRLSAPDGAFKGVVAAALRISYFSALFDAVRLPPGSLLMLLRTDGIVILRTPSTDGKGDIGLKLEGTPFFAALNEGRLKQETMLSPIDRIPRLYDVAQIESLPLKLVVGWSIPAVFEEWNRRVVITVGITAAVCALLVVTVSALGAALRRSEAAEARLEALAVTDQLTQLPNRRAIDEFLDAEVRRAQRYRHTLTVVMVDVDHFKRVNDSHGHIAGDAALRQIARLIAFDTRRAGGDMAGRYGGEEFLLVLPETDMAGGSRIAERIRSDVERAAIVLPSGDTIRVTVSAGLAQMRPSERPADLIARADAALYAAKSAGRNKVSSLENAAA